MKIIPLSELRNTAAVSNLIIENDVVYVTKQGSEFIVMLSHNEYEEIKRENKDLKLYIKVLSAELEQVKNGGKSRDFDAFIKEFENDTN